MVETAARRLRIGEMNLRSRGTLGRPLIGQLRRIVAVSGGLVLICLGVIGEARGSDYVAPFAFLLLAAAVVLGVFELASASRPVAVSEPSPRYTLKPARKMWLLATVSLGFVAVVIPQTWFQAQTALAGGDITLPEGISWISKLFDPWVWSGSDLGGPGAGERTLAAAPLFALIHALGGSGALAERVLYTSLFLAAAFGAFALIWALGFRPLPAVIGASFYVLNTFLVSAGMPSYTVLVTMALLPTVVAAVLAGSTGRLARSAAIVIIGLGAPALGLAYLNPPSAGICLAAIIVSPLLALCVFGRRAFVRSLMIAGIGLGLLVIVSAYWIVPAIVQLLVLPTGPLSDPSGWTWTEQRATIFNAFWLNTNWGWAYNYYYPYADAFSTPALSILKFVVPAVAFSALAWPRPPLTRVSRANARLRCAILFGGLALVVIFLSTGTRWPGSLLFLPLYHLPWGWLLREPGRFLLLAAICYAVLLALVAEYVSRCGAFRVQLARVFPRKRRLIAAVAAAVLGIVAVVPGFPIATGAIAPDTGTAAPAHVQLPIYWTEMASYVNSMPSTEPLLMLPLDDFYQMPFDWGFYGSDGFILNLINRPVVMPVGQGYTPASSQLVNAVATTTDAISSQDWPLLTDLLTNLRLRYILVRGDINDRLPGRSIASPKALSLALESAPNLELLHQSGPLQLFALKGEVPSKGEWASSFATINSQAPNLRVLKWLPAGTRLVSGPPEVGVPSVIQLPPIADWKLSNQVLSYEIALGGGWDYRVVNVAEQQSRPASRSIKELSVTKQSLADGARYQVSLPATANRIADGGFLKGVWQAVDDCNNQSGSKLPPGLNAEVLSGSGPSQRRALRLSATHDIACESSAIDWNGGPILVRLATRHVAGAGPRVCLWEFGVDHCASMPEVPISEGWSTYSAALTPDPGTTGVRLFLYADGSAPITVDDYADVQVVGLNSLPVVAFVGSPEGATQPAERLFVFHTSYSTLWAATSGERQVRVNGLVNGWLLEPSARRVTLVYKPVTALFIALLVSLVGCLVILILIGRLLWMRRRHD